MHALVRRMDRFLHEAELEGITRDPRYAINPGEFTRLSVVCQLLGYLELERSIPETRTHRADIVERADFLLAHYAEIYTGSATDGMLAYALLGAFEATGDARYRDAAEPILEQAKLLVGWRVTLNWGLMAGMGLARSHRLTGDPEARAQVDRILASLEDLRAADGSYPHTCERAPDVHYSAWMTMELFAIARELDDPAIRELALTTGAFLAERVGPTGATEYWGPCESCPTHQATYYSLGNGCVEDYDTRAWVNELGYIALALDAAGDARYERVLRFLAGHEDRGAFPDKWDYFAAPDDPIVVWAAEPRSVIRTSILFWTLSMILAERERPAAAGRLASSAAFDPLAAPVPAAPTLELAYAPATATFRFALPAPATARLAVHDVRGRRVRLLLDGESFAPGTHALAWDGRDERGRKLPAGVYFARLVAGTQRATVRIAR